MLEVGMKLPAVRLPDDSGREVNTTDLLGAPLVLWFYPKALTGG